MGTVTLGVSIAVPEPYGSSLQELRVGFGDAAALGIPTHVTLVPPTEVDAERLPAIQAHLAEVAATFRAFAMRLAGTGTFRPLSPVVFVRLVEGGAGCTRLQALLRDPDGPIDRELAFPYHPHVTVAHGISEEAMDLAFTTLSGYAADWLCEGFALYEQGSDGVWRKLREYPFGTGPTGVPAQLGSPTDEAAGTRGRRS
ncbi:MULTISPECIES: 2'-5' RNA ligase family protein [unclassified Streptomyces]|uniref:2'-5' RNA ligase family protein n=1 Tax=unclassified Streptomyces TaxID=2593676 RepID=UPI00226EF55D|nr:MULTISPECIES: 2'-5' RNA ligase family protein [unclassified Streptomyces]MCY0917483.1 2'-5' RNA ligase family protein [Streptomyces sp. H27-G5]MCY0956339.1 2'-5' RNA ligase family protein [Streptomyces sp. H27-H5]